MNHTTIIYSVEERIASVTLNRPDRRNALDDVMIRELTETFQSLNRNDGCRVVVLSGAGDSFCAGMDLNYLQRFSEKDHEENLEDARNLLKLLQLVCSLKKPVIAMVNGPALGGGCGLAVACDFVWASNENAKLGTPEVRLGFVPAVILLFLIKRMGEGKAKEFVLRGEILNAVRSKDAGLVTEVIEDSKLGESTYEFAKKLATSTSASSIALTKELFSRFNEMSIQDILEYSANLNALARKTDDFKKGINSFLKKEKLQW